MNELTKLQRQRRKKKLESVYRALAGADELHPLVLAHGIQRVALSYFQSPVHAAHLGGRVYLHDNKLTLSPPTASGTVIQTLGFLVSLGADTADVIMHQQEPIIIA